jgi:hypothetical protein
MNRKLIKVFLGSIFICLGIQSCNVYSCIKRETYYLVTNLKINPYAEISFGGGFRFDTLNNVILNDTIIAQNFLIDSPLKYGGGGPANLFYIINKKRKGYTITSWKNVVPEKNLSIKRKKVTMEIEINNKWQKIDIDIQKGRYVCIDFWNDTITYVQKKTPIQFY